MSEGVMFGSMIAGFAGFVLAAGLAVLHLAQWRLLARSQRSFESLQCEFERERRLCADTFVELTRRLAAAEKENSREKPRPGALSRSSRAEALRLLGSGQSPETAASSLGIGKREMKLLDRVARTLNPS